MANNVTYKIVIEKIGGREVQEFIGLPGELFYDPDRGHLRLSNGSNPGGINTSSSSETTDNTARIVAAAAFEKANQAVQNTFTTIIIATQNNIVSDSNVDILRFASGDGTSFVTDPGNNTLTITLTPSDSFIMGQVNAAFDRANSRAQNVYTVMVVADKGNVTATSNADGITLVPGAGISLSGSDNTITIGTLTNSFSTISVSGQSNVVADSNADTLTLVAGNGISITTNATTDTVTITAANTIDQTARSRANSVFDTLNASPVIVAHSAVGLPAAIATGTQTIRTVTVPGGSLGANGWVDIIALWTMSGSTSNKQLRLHTGSNTGEQIATVTTTNHIIMYQSGTIYNRSNTLQQVSTHPVTTYFGLTNTVVNPNHNVNTDNDWDIFFVVDKTTATDNVTLEQHTVISNYRP